MIPIKEISGCPNLASQMYYLLSDPVLRKTGRIFIWLAADQTQAISLWQLGKYWNQAKNLEFRSELLLPQNPDFLAALDSLRRRQPGLYVLQASYLEDLKLLMANLQDQVLKFRVRDLTSPLKIKEQLVKMGYEFGVDNRGGFCQRGANIIVYPSNEYQSLKIELDEIGISKIRAGAKSLNEIDILPSDLSSVIIGESSNFDFKECDFVATDPEFYSTSLPSWIETSFASKVVFSSLKPGEDFHLSKNYHKNFDAFLTDFVERQSQGWEIFIAASEPAVISNLFAAKAIEIGANTRIGTFQKGFEGFIFESQKIWMVTQKEIFGTAPVERGAPQKRRIDWGFFASLKPGDYLVHEDHGIGIYRGLVSVQVGNQLQERYLLEYGAGDKLYLPIDQAHKIDKYLGQPNPTVNRLSNQSWEGLKRRVRESAAKMARELLRLYARRSLVQLTPWQKIMDEERELAISFPYSVTPDQKKVIEEVFSDLEGAIPMDRLIVGDVGFGKTEVAVRAAFKAVMNGKQAVVLAPTTILVQQHLDTFRRRLQSFPVIVEGLSRFTSKLEGPRKERQVLLGLKTGGVDVVIGTHRLLSSDIKMKNLGLVIIDEEQRFGVRHKEKLKALRHQVHVMTLSATPIPRTLYLSLTGLRDVSTINTPPPGRKEITTKIEEYSDDLVKEAIELELNRGGQVYYLHNKVATISLKVKKLSELLGAQVRIGVVHGQMIEAEIAKNMSRFDNGQIDVLVCSSIIENGLDLPNVNTLIIEDATQFGLGQLYQLRGRIGRGLVNAYAYFLFRPEKVRGLAQKRLKALQEAQALGSGYQLALRDLEMRGVGNILGKEQHGSVSAVGLSTYLRLLNQAMREAEEGILIEPTEIKINLPLVVGISPNLVAEETERANVYYQLALINSLPELEKEIVKFKKMVDYKVWDEPTKNLFDLLRLKILGELAGIKSIDLMENLGINGESFGRLVIEFTENLKPNRVENFRKSGWSFAPQSVRKKFSSFSRKDLLELIGLLE